MAKTPDLIQGRLRVARVGGECYLGGMKPIGHAVAGPSLALIKYWGKHSSSENTPATGSLAVTLAELESRTEVSFDDRDSVVVGGEEQPLTRFAGFLTQLKG